MITAGVFYVVEQLLGEIAAAAEHISVVGLHLDGLAAEQLQQGFGQMGQAHHLVKLQKTGAAF